MTTHTKLKITKAVKKVLNRIKVAVPIACMLAYRILIFYVLVDIAFSVNYIAGVMSRNALF
jgi:hypothetical protein